MGDSALLNATEMSGNYLVLESAPGVQNKIFSSHFLSSLHLPSNVGLSLGAIGLSWEKVEFLFQMLQSLAGVSSAQCNHWGSRVLTTLLFLAEAMDFSLSLIFHVVLRRKLATWQWLLNALLDCARG